MNRLDNLEEGATKVGSSSERGPVIWKILLGRIYLLRRQRLSDAVDAVERHLFAPRGIPKAALDKLNGALQAAVQDPAFKARLAELGAQPVPLAKATPESLGNLLKSEIDKWTPIIRKSGVYAD